ncbi:hypothetical protein [Flexivirga alba]|uniref:Uncharacterized protein n=1 Tax=Flexivirga alba TaxID=702742 RepID=A0ABW2AI69_9MICO
MIARFADALVAPYAWQLLIAWAGVWPSVIPPTMTAVPHMPAAAMPTSFFTRSLKFVFRKCGAFKVA